MLNSHLPIFNPQCPYIKAALSADLSLLSDLDSQETYRLSMWECSRLKENGNTGEAAINRKELSAKYGSRMRALVTNSELLTWKL